MSFPKLFLFFLKDYKSVESRRVASHTRKTNNRSEDLHLKARASSVRVGNLED